MFGAKAAQIEDLRDKVSDLEKALVCKQSDLEAADKLIGRLDIDKQDLQIKAENLTTQLVSSQDELEASEIQVSELNASVLNISRAVEQKTEQYVTLNKSFQDVAQKNCDLNVAIADQSLELDAAETFLSETQECNEVLHEENSDLVRQLELYKAVLGQLSIVVKVPARRKK